MKRILGIDTGTNSLGWAIVDKHEDETYSLVNKGSLIFQEGVNIEKGIESSKASERTMHRASRRHYFRRRLRKIEVLKVLVKNGWCPQLTDEELNLWHTAKQYPKNDSFMLWQRTNENIDQNPYYYRHICLHERLDLENENEAFILGRALYHLAQRRGFISNRLEQSEEEESGAVKEGISLLSNDMKEAGCDFLGDYFYKLYKENGNKVRIRNRYTDREEHYLKEFHAICQCQRLTVEQVKELERALYFQRPLKSQRQNVGKCTFEPAKPRCADSHPDFEKFRMLQTLNSIKVKGVYDVELRPLNDEERQKAMPMFFRKSKSTFDFEDIAKAIAGKNKYQNIKDEGDKPYKFNYRNEQGLAGCPTIASFISVFGENYEEAISEIYRLAEGKSKSDMVNDVWNVLYSFTDREHLKQWGIDYLQFGEEDAEKFSKIKLTHNFASLSLCAIRKILPWLEKGMIYSHATLLAKIPDIIGHALFEEQKDEIVGDVMALIECFDNTQGRIDSVIKEYLLNNFDLKPGTAESLYHPSMIDVYPDARFDARKNCYQLGSPQTNSVRNPMAMRSLHQLRRVINQLLRDKIIDQNTEIHIEYARELNDSNKRKAILRWNKDREKERMKYADEIKKIFGDSYVPTDRDLLKFQLWEEQNHRCLYTDEQIGITDFLGSHPKYDIEHTIPRSVGGDFLMENMTLCSSKFNRDIKKAKLPSQLANHEEIMIRLAPWKEKIEELRKKADKIRTHSGMDKDTKDRLIQKRHLLRLELDYWQGKYKRFQMTEVPQGFSLRQGAGIGLISKFAGLYLKTLFHQHDNRERSNVRVIKGAVTAEYRKMWGIQDEYEKKSRDNHVHHCIDAITIACIEPGQYNETARYYQQYEEYERNQGSKPSFRKPWPTFTEDILNLFREVIVVHNNPDNLLKSQNKTIRTSNGKFVAKGDSVRGTLHKDTIYGMIERDGEMKYVVRRPFTSFEKESDLDSIVDDSVRQTIKNAVNLLGFKAVMEKATKGELYLNVEKGVAIKTVRCFVSGPVSGKVISVRQLRDRSRHDYKNHHYAENGDNYMLAIYEAPDGKRTFETVNIMDTAKAYKSVDNAKLLKKYTPDNSLIFILKKGMHVILVEKSKDEVDLTNISDISKRLYVISGLSTSSIVTGGRTYQYGMVSMKHSQEAKASSECKEKKGEFKMGEEYRAKIVMNHNQFKALVENVDFKIDCTGKISKL